MTGKLARRSPALVAAKRTAALRSLEVLEGELATRDYVAGDQYTIADISLYAYGGRAAEAGLDLAPYPHLRAWMSRVEAQPRFLDQDHPYAMDPHSGNELP